MSLRKFNNDIAAAAARFADGAAVACVQSVGKGDSEGEVVFAYANESLPSPIRLQAFAQDASEYPDGNNFILCTDSDVPGFVAAALQEAQNFCFGMKVAEMIKAVADALNSSLKVHGKRRMSNQRQAEPSEDVDMTDVEDDQDDPDYDNSEEMDEDMEEDDDAYDGYDEYDDDSDFGLPSDRPFRGSVPGRAESRELVQRMKRDLRRVKNAGYKIGILEGMSRDAARGTTCISIRVNKLGLSEEALQAWGLQDSEYFVMLMRYETRYITFERAVERPEGESKIDFRVGKCNRYKPSLVSALAAFSQSNRVEQNAESIDAQSRDAGGSDSFEKLFISSSMEQFLNEKFVRLVKLRSYQKVSWHAANEMDLNLVSAGEYPRAGGKTADNAIDLTGEDSDAGGTSSVDHQVLQGDHLTEECEHRSLPLIAIQFAMQYFVKCTEYCLVCHRSLEKGFEALRPYVCSNGLCLFQYLTMGFGPSIEHEVITEPFVVDLLVSLCYASVNPFHVGGMANGLPIRDFPVGLHLKVPNLSDRSPTSPNPPILGQVLANMTMLQLEPGSLVHRLRENSWIAIRKASKEGEQQPLYFDHAIIANINELRLDIRRMGHSGGLLPVSIELATGPAGEQQTHTSTVLTWLRDGDIVEILPYDLDFDTLEHVDKGAAMRHVLDTLPSVTEMKAYLTSNPHDNLRSMKAISPAAFSVLQWIVSSNRSCIFYVGTDPTADPTPSAEGQVTQEPASPGPFEFPSKPREQELILGMKGWVQFRFAQGSPDKELRFHQALQEVATRKGLVGGYPTLFAWHGSNVANWHSIVRTGLDFKDVRCGRAFGNGVYFSPEITTSMSYSSMGSGTAWPNSILQVRTVLSLNEIINAPDEYVSSTPHYVVKELDWIQCRHLFVQTRHNTVNTFAQRIVAPTPLPGTPAVQTTLPVDKPSGKFFPQDKNRQVKGPGGQVLHIPVAAVPPRSVAVKGLTLKNKRVIRPLSEDSGDEEVGDVDFLFSEPEDDDDDGRDEAHNSQITPKASVEAMHITADKAFTDFVPGALDLASLPRLEPPSWATDMATKAIGREISKLQKTQATTPLHELGWFVDFENMANLFQWIVELHSFPKELPLAQDMKRAGVTSVVLEIRFGKDFPYAPPFIRAVRPRFLPFQQGGGGHVTAGGAMCMELLTNDGWLPTYGLENVFVQVRMALCSTTPKPARLLNTLPRRPLPPASDKPGFGGLSALFARGRKDQPAGGVAASDPNDTTTYMTTGADDYGVGEAIDAYIRACNVHGWTVPKDFRATAMGHGE